MKKITIFNTLSMIAAGILRGHMQADTWTAKPRENRKPHRLDGKRKPSMKPLCHPEEIVNSQVVEFFQVVVALQGLTALSFFVNIDWPRGVTGMLMGKLESNAKWYHCGPDQGFVWPFQETLLQHSYHCVWHVFLYWYMGRDRPA